MCEVIDFIEFLRVLSRKKRGRLHEVRDDGGVITRTFCFDLSFSRFLHAHATSDAPVLIGIWNTGRTLLACAAVHAFFCDHIIHYKSIVVEVTTQYPASHSLPTDRRLCLTISVVEETSPA